MTNSSTDTSQLPPPLRSLVRFSIDSLGRAIQAWRGESFLKKIEDLRRHLKDFRGFTEQEKYKKLQALLAQFQAKNNEELFDIAHVFTLYLETINRCEKAYRHARAAESSLAVPQVPSKLIYVFTAHPTEARSRAAMELLEEVERILIVWLKGKDTTEEALEAELRHVMNLLLRISISKEKSPTVADEAQYIFAVILDNALIEEHIKLYDQQVNLHFRTWVGGDKDGHPFVDEKTMLQSWTLSRAPLLRFLLGKLNTVRELIKDVPLRNGASLRAQLKKLERSLDSLMQVKARDGERITKLKNHLSVFSKLYFAEVGADSPEVNAILTLTKIYPALVVPLEIREDAQLATEALAKPRATVARMLAQLAKVSQGGEAKSYAQGFILSMTQSYADIRNGIKLMRKHLRGNEIPVIPLFETQSALENAEAILVQIFEREKAYMKLSRKNWSGKYEVMLGYSDSSKENGVLLSRFLIASTLRKLDALYKKYKLVPVFFHGSGGSIERGGGSLQEQVAWWPKSALLQYKSTIQGEMISRSFGDAKIMRNNIVKILREYENRSDEPVAPESEVFVRFANEVADAYKKLVKSTEFIDVVKAATPYLFLDQLKIGSRPSKRQKNNQDFKMRAIPWVLCFTQTRVLFSAWWGIGTFWRQASKQDKQQLKALYQESAQFRSFLNILGFTLAKVEMSVFRTYLEANIPSEKADVVYQAFVTEIDSVMQFYREVTAKEDLLWFKPWLRESIQYRSPMIHPLNLIQIVSIHRNNMNLLRETTTGIACGMLTTG